MEWQWSSAYGMPSTPEGTYRSDRLIGAGQYRTSVRRWIAADQGGLDGTARPGFPCSRAIAVAARVPLAFLLCWSWCSWPCAVDPARPRLPATTGPRLGASAIRARAQPASRQPDEGGLRLPPRTGGSTARPRSASITAALDDRVLRHRHQARRQPRQATASATGNTSARTRPRSPTRPTTTASGSSRRSSCSTRAASPR